MRQRRAGLDRALAFVVVLMPVAMGAWAWWAVNLLTGVVAAAGAGLLFLFAYGARRLPRDSRIRAVNRIVGPVALLALGVVLATGFPQRADARLGWPIIVAVLTAEVPQLAGVLAGPDTRARRLLSAIEQRLGFTDTKEEAR